MQIESTLSNDYLRMQSPTGKSLRDFTVLALINTFGVVYFSIFSVYLCINYFPSSPSSILKLISVIFFCCGMISWCLTSLVYRTINLFNDNDQSEWQKLEFCGAMVLISAAAIPYVVLQFASQPSVRLGYICSLSLATVAYLVDFLVIDAEARVARVRFPYHCTSLGLLSLVPAIYAVAEPDYIASPLTYLLLRLALCVALCALNYAIRPLERLQIICGWQPSLYLLHLAIVYSAFAYSKAIVESRLI